MSSAWKYFPSAGQFCYSFLLLFLQDLAMASFFNLSSLNGLHFPKPTVYKKFSDWREARVALQVIFSPAALELGLPKWLS